MDNKLGMIRTPMTPPHTIGRSRSLGRPTNHGANHVHSGLRPLGESGSSKGRFRSIVKSSATAVCDSKRSWRTYGMNDNGEDCYDEHHTTAATYHSTNDDDCNSWHAQSWYEFIRNLVGGSNKCTHLMRTLGTLSNGIFLFAASASTYYG